MLQAVRALHLLFAACWIGAYVAGDYLIRTRGKSDNPTERIRAARAILVGLEMPLAAIVPLLGLGLAAMNTHVLGQAWFHTKLLAFVIVFGMLMAQAKRMRLVLESDDPDSAVGGYLVLRLAGGLMFFVIIAAVVLRFGSV
jgi:uncharacterized membrane protein